ncbi:zinc finger BED domain-containing protein 5-like [Homarus americanus]|uniref:zinc finger BED domain-containing protein 5-like n=1 Tax=Homarus americanus TaxID=6706 RepID=UPI001C452C9F|nr:zinc finger BED domain-containing protein 5-like [Homarus americanus]
MQLEALPSRRISSDEEPAVETWKDLGAGWGVSVAKKRKYIDGYINYGFTSILADGIEKPQCVLCFKVLGNDSMRPSKVKHHLMTIHPQYAQRDTDFFRRHERSLEKQKLDESGAFQQQTVSVVEASYEVSLEIAKQKKPHTIGETLIKPCALKMVKRVLGEESEREIQQISLSNDTVKRRSNEMSDDIKEKVIQEIKLSPTGMFAIQLDESTDASSCAQLLVFVRYVFLCDIKEEYLFRTQLETTTTAVDVLEKLSSFFTANRISWENCCGVCTDGAPAMLGSKSGFQKRVKEVAPNAKGIHCMIHRFAQASKTLPDELGGSGQMCQLCESWRSELSLFPEPL